MQHREKQHIDNFNNTTAKWDVQIWRALYIYLMGIMCGVANNINAVEQYNYSRKPQHAGSNLNRS